MLIMPKYFRYRSMNSQGAIMKRKVRSSRNHLVTNRDFSQGR